jgi:RimJ/RimL family protein N-acetyltransferase
LSNSQKIILSTPRFILREMQENDLPLLGKIFDEATAMTFFTKDQKREKAKIWIAHMLKSYKENGFGMWLCFFKESREFVGQCGLMKNEIDGKEEIELGYSILRKFWNRGYANEVAQGCIEFGFKNINVPRIVSVIEKENVASVHVSKKIGMNKERQILRGQKTVDLFSIDRK